jgi:hypothetical protein
LPSSSIFIAKSKTLIRFASFCFIVYLLNNEFIKVLTKCYPWRCFFRAKADTREGEALYRRRADFSRRRNDLFSLLRVAPSPFHDILEP